MNRAERRINLVYDYMEHIWHSPKNWRIIGSVIVLGFIVALGLILLNQSNLLPAVLARLIPVNLFYAIHFAFTMLLVFEIISLIFVLADSVANALGKQFEILSLIFLRRSFKEFVHFNGTVAWENLASTIYHIAADAGAALLIFFLLAYYYRLQRHRPIVDDKDNLGHFVMAKKGVALLLIAAFTTIGLYDLIFRHGAVSWHTFFHTIYTILIFSDILLVLISLRYCTIYSVVFRNSGFALATAMIRIALVASFYLSIFLGIGAAVFVLLLSLVYNVFNLEQERQGG